MMELWYSEKHTDNAKFSMRVMQHLFTGKSAFQQIDVFDTYEYGRVLVLDGVVMLTEKDEFIYNDMITHVAMAANPDIKKVLVIGGGNGGAVRELARYKTIEKIELVEIDDLVVRVSKKYLPFTSSNLDDRRVTVYIEDGIKFVKGKNEVYDLIIVDSTDSIGPGEGLFTTEFYSDCHNALTEKGILVKQIESSYYEYNSKEIMRATGKLKKIFPIVEAYQYHIPTYPSRHWLIEFASKELHPIKDFKPERWESLGLKTKYYNTTLHIGAFALPTYVKEMIDNGKA